jgi:hypothetical protein
MSGPKRADVQAELRNAQKSARAAAARVADAENAVLKTLVADLDRADEARAPTSGADAQLAGCRPDVGAVGEARAALRAAQSLRTQADAAAGQARRQVTAAAEVHQRCLDEYDGATAEFDRAKAGLGTKQHYLHDEMSWAKEANRRFGVAADLGATARKARATARKSAGDALSLARRAQAAERDAVARVTAAVAESAQRARAEEQARRIAEEKLRLATIAVDAARAALDGLPAGDCDKFAAGSRQALADRLAEAHRTLDGADSAAAQSRAQGVARDAAGLAQRVALARTEFDRNLADAQTEARQLQAVIDATDAALISRWSDDPDAPAVATDGLHEIEALIAAERFREASSRAAELSDRLQAATAGAAESQAANDRRTSIGEAIMDVLEEMDFDVSFEPGTKSAPMRISGQVPDVAGKGDFTMDIPLDGEVDFEVTDPQREGSGCSNAVATLRERLAARGIGFTVTDWGHGHEPADTPPPELTGPREVVREHTVTHEW